MKPTQAKAVQSDAIVEHVISLVDMLVLLDALKDMKACLLNDFSRYKRSFQPIRTELTDADAISEEIHNLQMFLGNPQQPHNLIMFHLKTDIHKIQKYDDVLSVLFNHAVDCLERKQW